MPCGERPTLGHEHLKRLLGVFIAHNTVVGGSWLNGLTIVHFYLLGHSNNLDF